VNHLQDGLDVVASIMRVLQEWFNYNWILRPWVFVLKAKCCICEEISALNNIKAEENYIQNNVIIDSSCQRVFLAFLDEKQVEESKTQSFIEKLKKKFRQRQV